MSKRLAKAVAGPDLSAEATFALSWIGTVGGAALSTDSDPNSAAPSAGRILRITGKRGALCTHSGVSVIKYVAANGTAITVQPWFYDDTRAVWIKFGGTTTITVGTTNIGTSTGAVGNMAGAKFFVQVTANAGVTALGYDYN